jgi:hypothetical protein
MATWYCTKHGQKMGPFSEDQLRLLAASGLLWPSDLVLEEGGLQWVSAPHVPGLFPEPAPALAPTPPPLPATARYGVRRPRG